MTETDKRFLLRYPEPEWQHLTTAVFSAKETLFKALYPKVCAFFGFSAASLAAAPAKSRIRLVLNQDLHPVFPAKSCFDIRLRHYNSHVITWLMHPCKPAQD